MSQNASNDKQVMLTMIDGINKVEGFDPYPLAIDIADLNSSETRKHLPVVVQIAWFRLKYPEGKISTTVTRDQDYYVATSRVYPSYKDGADAYLAEGTAARKYNAEMPSVNPREWAQTASVGIALRNAGFGLQFALAGEDIEPTPLYSGAGKPADSSGAVSSAEVNAEEYSAAEPPAPPVELTMEEKYARALMVPCPITKYSGKTLGEVVTFDPRAIRWCAESFQGDPAVSDAAKVIIEYAVQQATP